MALGAGGGPLLSASPVALDRAIDGGASDAEQVAELGGAVFAGAVQRDEVRFLARVELGLPSLEAAFWPWRRACPPWFATG